MVWDKLGEEERGKDKDFVLVGEVDEAQKLEVVPDDGVV